MEDILIGEEIQVKDIRKGVYQLIQKEYPSISKTSFISIDELNHYRRKYLTSLITLEKGELANIHQDVLKAMENNELLSETIQNQNDTTTTRSEKLADQVASFGGSWKFILSFFTFILLWIVFNLSLVIQSPADPYPFILLNLILSCLAAIQAPIIIMSQNRQDQKDRLRREHDYKINLKAELEIKLLSDKIDHLLVYQNRKLLEIQEIQTDYLEDLLKEIKKSG